MRPKGYADVVLDVLEEELADNVPLMAINAAIPGVFGLKSFEAKHPVNYLVCSEPMISCRMTLL